MSKPSDTNQEVPQNWDSGRFQLPSVWGNLFIMKYKGLCPMTDTRLGLTFNPHHVIMIR